MCKRLAEDSIRFLDSVQHLQLYLVVRTVKLSVIVCARYRWILKLIDGSAAQEYRIKDHIPRV